MLLFFIKKKKHTYAHTPNFSYLCDFSKETQQDSFHQKPCYAAYRAEFRSAKTSQ